MFLINYCSYGGQDIYRLRINNKYLHGMFETYKKLQMQFRNLKKKYQHYALKYQLCKNCTKRQQSSFVHCCTLFFLFARYSFFCRLKRLWGEDLLLCLLYIFILTIKQTRYLKNVLQIRSFFNLVPNNESIKNVKK